MGTDGCHRGVGRDGSACGWVQRLQAMHPALASWSGKEAALPSFGVLSEAVLDYDRTPKTRFGRQTPRRLTLPVTVDGVDDASQVVLATHTVREALFTINRPLVVKIIESRAHGKRFNPSILLLQVRPHHGFPEFLSCR